MEVIPSAGGGKPSVRAQFRQARAQFAQASGLAARPYLEQHIQRLAQDLAEPHLQICLYRPLADEAQFFIRPEREFFYPRLSGEQIEFYRPRGPFLPGRFGIEEPDPKKADPLDLSKPILVFCPAVAVDLCGTRLGMGKGHFDRFFSRNPGAQRAAVVYQVQVSKSPLHADSWDQPMDWIVTEKMILRTLRRSS